MPSIRTWILLAVASATFFGVWRACDHIFDMGANACEQKHLLLDAAQAEESHQLYLASIEEGNRLSAKLAETQRRLDDTKREYMAYANGISGNCPASVGVLSNAAAAGLPLPAPTGKPAQPATSPAAKPAAQ